MKILIDNGHGKETPGKCSPDGRLKEYAYTREIADRVVTGLQNEGIDAQRIVPGENDVSMHSVKMLYWYQSTAMRWGMVLSGCPQADGAYLLVSMLQ